MGRARRFFRGLFSPRLGYLGSAASTPRNVFTPAPLTTDVVDDSHVSSAWPHPASEPSFRSPEAAMPITVLREGHEAADRLVAAFRAVRPQGGAVHAAFAVGGLDDDRHLIHRVLRSPALIQAVPELEPVDDDPDEGFEPTSASALSDHICQVLLAGGYRGRFNGSADTAAELVENYLQEIGFDPATWQVHVSWLYWSEWFGAVVWDVTWLMVDPGRDRVFLLAATDTD